ncbi:YeiH family protein [Algoriphagus sp. A40]|uniref:YeiH family protein n=1 Tax=Algoriphagus sp. A40 TaxID=1945863 RepID=UPI000985278C|nr:putative sulfate exporter family transporter [Algoriphagus sp. A40]OOG73749.1 sulfate transporter [Algoriphagus sp. A40]
MNKPEIPSPEKTGKNWSINEDWASVLAGAGVILTVLFLFKFSNPSYNWKSGADLVGIFSSAENLSSLFAQLVLVFVFSAVAAVLIGKKILPLAGSFLGVFALTQVALLVAGSGLARQFNLEAVIFSLAFGLLIGNLVKLPEWFKKNLTTELFVKIGLVLLGASVIFGDILKAGGLGLIQALLVVISVWYFAFWVCKKLKVDEELRMMISSAVSICGVSAAIATSGAIHGDSKKLSYVISMVLITAIPMMLLMPLAAEWMGLSEEVTGAWLGGSIDTSGAVVASGSLVGEKALQISTIVKFSQNVLLGVAAFAISVYWTYTQTPEGQHYEKPTLGVIWERFPKFVLGFLGASILFSFFIETEVYNEVKGSLKSFQNLWFALAFTSIGLETNFKDLIQESNQKPLFAFLIAQGFNVLITLGIAYFLFS